MTIRAVAKLDSATIINDPTVPADSYATACVVYAVDSADPASVLNVNIPVYVSYALKPRKADSFIRQAIADVLLSDHGLTVDPDDIYFPMTN